MSAKGTIRGDCCKCGKMLYRDSAFVQLPDRIYCWACYQKAYPTSAAHPPVPLEHWQDTTGAQT